MDLERRVVVRGGLGVLEAATLIDGDIHQDSARLHLRDSGIRDELGCLGAGHQHRADHQIGLLDRGLQFQPRRIAGLDGAAVLGVDLAQRVDVQVEDSDMGAHAPRDGSGVVAGHAAADHHDSGGCDTGNAAHEHAAAALGAHQVISADVRREAAGDLTHRRQQGQGAVGGLHGLVGDRGGTRGQ